MKSRRKKYLINKQYQYSHLVLLLSIIFIAIFICIIATHYFLLSSIVSATDKTGIPPTRTGIDKNINNFFFISFLTSFFIIFIILVFAFIYIIFISHRTAGPMYHLIKAMEKVEKGDLSVKIKFRKNDEIHDVAKSFNKMVEGLRKKYREDKKL